MFKELINKRWFKPVTLTVLFVLSAFITYYASYLIVPMITHYGRFTLSYLPTVFTLYMFLFTFGMLWLYWHVYNVASKWLIAKVYSITLIIVEAVSLLIHIIMICHEFKWNRLSGVISPLFPFDILALMVIFLALGIVILVWVIKNKELKKVAKTSTFALKRGTAAAFLTVAGFGNYFLGLFIYSFTVCDYFDPNWYGMVPVILSFLTISIELVFYSLYQYAPNEEKRKWQFRGVLVTLIITLVLYTWLAIALMINSRLIIESLSNFFILGYTIKIPIGLFLNALIVLITCLVAIIKLKTKKEKHE